MRFGSVFLGKLLLFFKKVLLIRFHQCVPEFVIELRLLDLCAPSCYEIKIKENNVAMKSCFDLYLKVCIWQKSSLKNDQEAICNNCLCCQAEILRKIYCSVDIPGLTPPAELEITSWTSRHFGGNKTGDDYLGRVRDLNKMTRRHHWRSSVITLSPILFTAYTPSGCLFHFALKKTEVVWAKLAWAQTEVRGTEKEKQAPYYVTSCWGNLCFTPKVCLYCQWNTIHLKITSLMSNLFVLPSLCCLALCWNQSTQPFQ